MGSNVPRLGQSELGDHAADVILGILTAQTFLFYRNSEDGMLLKGLVGFLWVLVLANNVCIWHGLYDESITHFGDPNVSQSMEIITLDAIPPILNAFLGPPVQAFFAYRIRRFSGNSMIPAICYILASAYLALGVSSGVGAPLSTNIIEWTRIWRSVYVTRTILGAVNDIIITTTLCYYLLINRQSAFERTAKLIDKLIIWTIPTGLVTSIFAWITILTFFVSFDTYQWILWDMITVRLFPISLLAALLVRPKLRALAMEQINYTASIHTMPIFQKAAAVAKSVGVHCSANPNGSDRY